jgi:prepilin-type N-terminal cleavage/methylation domain-containing protein
MDAKRRSTIYPTTYIYRRLLNHKLVAAMEARDKTRFTNRGFTLIETIIVLLLLAMLLGVAGFVFVVSLRAWDAGRIRGGIREDVSYAMEKAVRDLKEMANGSLRQYNSIANTIEYRAFRPDGGGNTYVFYLYNSADLSFDSSYTKSLYDLRKADITQGEDPASGEGTLILRDLVSPDATTPATALTISSTEVTLDCVVQRSDEIVRARTKVRPRNL